MSVQTISIAEGKKHLSRLIRDASSGKGEIVLTNRGKPVAVLIPYESYRDSKRVAGLRGIMEARVAYGEAGLKADEIIEEARRELRRRP